MTLRPRIKTLCSLACTGCLTLTGAAQNPVYRTRLKPERATVTILATSSAVHMLSGNQDTFVAEIASKGEQRGLAKLIDRYRGYDDPIRRTWLESLHPLEMRLLRDEGCDAEAASVHLPRGDADIYDVRVRQSLRERGPEVLPCYLVDHKATRLSR